VGASRRYRLGFSIKSSRDADRRLKKGRELQDYEHTFVVIIKKGTIYRDTLN